MSQRRRESVFGRVSGVAVLGLALGAVGCRSATEIDYSSIRGLTTANAPALAAVFSPDGGLLSTPGWEDSRRDQALGVRSSGPRLASDDWPRDPRPSLRAQRRGRYTTDSRSYLYYEAEPNRPVIRRRW